MDQRVYLRRRLRDTHARFRVHASEPVFSATYNLMASTLVTSVLGIGFWALAARLYPASDVGRDSVLIAALMTLSSICQLNLFDALVRFLPGVPTNRRVRTIAAAYGASSLAAAVGGTAFVLIAPLASQQLRFLSRDPGLAALFVGALVAWGIFVIQDAALTSLRRSRWLPIENASFSVAKIALLPVLLATASGHGVFVAWVVPSAVIVVVINRMMMTRVLRPAAHAPAIAAASTIPSRSKLTRFLAQDYAAYIFTQVPLTLLPIIVIANLGSRMAAYFSIPMSLVAALDVLFYSATTSLTVEAAHDESRTAELARKVARRFLTLQVPLAALIALAAPLILLPFGPAYVHHGAAPLRLLACASIFRTVGYLFSALARMHVRGTAIMLAQGCLALVSTALAFVLVRPLGLPGVALAWLIANVAVAIVVSPSLRRFMRLRPVGVLSAG